MIFRHVILSPLTYRIIRYGLSLVFIAAGLTKLVNLDIFLMILEIYIEESSFVIPMTLLKPAALVLAFFEIVTGLGLFFDLRGFLTLISVQMACFIALLLYGIFTGLDVPCGCFVLNDPDKPFHEGLAPALYRDLVLVAAVIYLYWWRLRSKEPMTP